MAGLLPVTRCSYSGDGTTCITAAGSRSAMPLTLPCPQYLHDYNSVHYSTLPRNTRQWKAAEKKALLMNCALVQRYKFGVHGRDRNARYGVQEMMMPSTRATEQLRGPPPRLVSCAVARKKARTRSVRCHSRCGCRLMQHALPRTA